MRYTYRFEGGILLVYDGPVVFVRLTLSVLAHYGRYHLEGRDVAGILSPTGDTFARRDMYLAAHDEAVERGLIK